jgi:hypothetical protein
MILLKIAHERNDKAERLAELEYFKEKEQRAGTLRERVVQAGAGFVRGVARRCDARC